MASMTELLEIIEGVDGEAHVVSLRGELDISTSRQLDARLRSLLAQHKQVVLDLSELSFIDSSGLAVLITTARAADMDGGGFAVRAVSESALRVLELSGVAKQLRLLPDRS